MTRERRPPRPGAGQSPARPPGESEGTSASTAWPDHPIADQPPRADPPPTGEADADRIAKVMARAGLCSRRDAEDWIAAGRIAINGTTITSPAVNVSARDRVTIDGKPLPRRERTRLFLYYKPVGLITTNVDPQGRPTVFDALPTTLPRLMSVGRLDVGTEGLLLLTNDGGLARVLELPGTQWLRLYRVRAHGRVTQDALDRLREGIAIDGVQYGPIEATLEREQGANVWLSFAIREGKNREVRNVLSHLGLQVNRLIRVAYGPFRLGELKDGAVVEVDTAEIREQLGADVIALAECDFTSPIAARPAEKAPHRDERGENRVGEGRDRPRDGRGTDHRGHDGRGPLRRSRSRSDEVEEKPAGRPRRKHAWRQDDAPLRRTYRGSRRDDLKIPDEQRADKRAGLLTDRKGRRILVERFGTKAPTPEPVEKPARPPRRPPRDRSAGPRPARPRFSESRSTEERAPESPQYGSRDDRARHSGPRPPRAGFSGSGAAPKRSSGPRIFGSPDERPQKFRPRPQRTEFSERGDPEQRASRPRKPGSRDEQSRTFGVRPPRSKFPESGASETRSPGPRKFGSRDDRPKNFGSGKPGSHKPGSRKPGSRDGRPRDFGSRPPEKSGPRPPRPAGPRPPRSSGPRPPRPPRAR